MRQRLKIHLDSFRKPLRHLQWALSDASWLAGEWENTVKNVQSLLPSHMPKLFWWNGDLDKTILRLRLFGTGPVNYWRNFKKISYTCSSVIFDPVKSDEVLNAQESGLWPLIGSGERILKWPLYQHLSECSRVTQFTQRVSGELQKLNK